LLLRFWDYSEPGKIILGEDDLHRYNQDDLRKKIAVVAQNTYLFCATVRENLLIAKPDATHEEIIKAAKGAKIHDLIQSRREKYDTWIGEHGLQFSAGERQRLAIARVLLKNAPLLILDEATANLDAITEREVMETIHSLMKGRTTLMVTHRLVGLERMDEILVLEKGEIVERGLHKELLALRGLYRQMWDLQNQILLEEQTARFFPENHSNPF
jgi:ABC-type multidrug transport system fused ATPase/permease subunit